MSNEFITSRQSYKGGLFPAKIDIPLNRGILLRNSETEELIEVSKNTTTWEIFSKKFNEKIEIDIKDRELYLELKFDSFHDDYKFVIKFSISLTVKDCIQCFYTTVSNIETQTEKIIRRKLKSITKKFNVISYDDMPLEIENILTQNVLSEGLAGFELKLIDVDCSVDENAKEYIRRLAKLQDQNHTLAFNAESKDFGYSFVFKAYVKITKLNSSSFSLMESDEIIARIIQKNSLHIRNVASKYSILEHKKILSEVPSLLANMTYEIDNFSFSTSDVLFELDEKSTRAVEKAVMMENKVFIISLKAESQNNLCFFDITAKTKITVLDIVPFGLIATENEIIDLINAMISSSVQDIVKNYSVVQYEKLNYELNKLANEHNSNNVTKSFSYEILSFECKLADDSKEHAKRITDAKLGKEASIAEINSRETVDKQIRENISKPIDMLTALQMGIKRGDITEEQAIIKYNAYLQDTFTKGHENFDKLLDTLEQMRERDLIKPDVTNSFLAKAKEILLGLVPTDLNNANRLLLHSQVTSEPYENNNSFNQDAIAAAKRNVEHECEVIDNE